MLNKALLMAIGGKKKVVPTNGTFFSKFSVVVGVPEAPEMGFVSGVALGDNAVTSDTGEFGEYKLLSGEDMVSDGGFVLMNALDIAINASSPHLFDESFIVKDRICALVDETTNKVYYGFYEFGQTDGFWIIMMKSYEDARAFLDGKALDENEPFIPFFPEDVGKKFIFSFYICD